MSRRRNTVGAIYGRRPDMSTIEGHPFIVGTGRVGIEIELEGIRDGSFRNPYWTVKGDGSLRNNGLEFVFSAPYGGVDLHNAILALDSFLFDKNPDPSWRCSTHVHLDVRYMTVPQLRFLTLAYLVYEKFLFRLSGIHRYNNNFCPAIGFAQQQLDVLGRAFAQSNDDDFLSSILSSWDKYSALNFLPISSFGSVEFRLSEAKWRKGMLVRLCNRLLSLREVAMSWSGSERELIDYLASVHPREIMGQGLPKNLGFDHMDDILVGQKLAHDLLSFSESGSTNVDFPETPRPSDGVDVDAILRRARETMQAHGADARIRSTFASLDELSGSIARPAAARPRRNPWVRLTSFEGTHPLPVSVGDWHRIAALAQRLRFALNLTPSSDFTCESFENWLIMGSAPGETPESFLSGEALTTYQAYLDEIPSADIEVVVGEGDEDPVEW